MATSHSLLDRTSIRELLRRIPASGSTISPPDQQHTPPRRQRIHVPRPDDQGESTPAPRLPPLSELTGDDTAILDGQLQGTSLNQRLTAFADWLMASTASYAIFIADEQGLPLVNRNCPNEFVGISGTLGRAMDQATSILSSQGESASTIEIADHNMLQIVWVRTALGRLAVGLIIAEPLSNELREKIRSVLRNFTDLSTKAGASDV